MSELNLLHYWHLVLGDLVIIFQLFQNLFFLDKFQHKWNLYLWQIWQYCQNCLTEKNSNKYTKLKMLKSLYCLNFPNTMDRKISHFKYNLKHKCKFALKLIRLFTVSNILPLELCKKKAFQYRYLPLACVLIAMRRQHQRRGTPDPELDKFEQVCSDIHQISLARGEEVTLSHCPSIYFYKQI